MTEEIAQRVRAAPARAGDTKIVAIDGPSGSGKTTLAGRLNRWARQEREYFAGDRVRERAGLLIGSR